MLIGIDGKILHLKELDFIERTLYNSILNQDKFYTDLKGYMENERIGYKAYIPPEDIKKLDGFVNNYLSALVDEHRKWMLRAYIVGRLLSQSDMYGTIFKVKEISLLPEVLKVAAKEYGLSLQEVKAMQYTMENGAALISNTVQNSSEIVRNAVIEAIKRGEGVQGAFKRLRDEITGDMGEINRDWQAVAITEVNAAFSNGYLSLQKEGDFVVGLSMPDACESCLELINGKIYKVRKDIPKDYSNLTGEEYEKAAKIWETEVWEGKNNFGRSTSKQKRIDKTIGNKKSNLMEKHHHENSMPVIPLHTHCFKGDTEIYTKNGWQRFDEIQKGLEVATLNIATRELEYQTPYAYIEHNYFGKMVRFYNNFQSLECTEDHDLLVDKRPSNKDRKYFELNKVKAKDLDGEINFYQKVEYNGFSKNIVIGNLSLPEELFAKLMGYYLSEGSCSRKRYGHEIKISQYKTNNNELIYKDLIQLQELFGIHLRKSDSSIQFNNADLYKYLIELDLQPNRYIPEEVKRMSKKSINLFVDAYVLGDGTTRKTKGVIKGKTISSMSRYIYTSSKQMADDFTEILLKAGFSVSYQLDKTKGKICKFRNGDYKINHDLWRICIKNSKHAKLEKKEISEFEGKVYCVSVPNTTILIRQRNFVVWTGNCRCRWVHFNPKFEYIDGNDVVKLRVEDPEAWEKWYKENEDKLN